MSFSIEWAAQSDTGLHREENQDSFLADDTEEVWVVCDGMGGHQGGELASVLAVEAVHSFLVDLRHDDQVSARFPRDPTAQPAARDLVAAIQYANERIFIESVKDPAKQGMGTTGVAVYRVGDELVLAHVGDSRIYRFRAGYLEQLTDDHSLINHLLAQGRITPAQVAEGQAPKNVIVRALGMKNQVEVTSRVEPLVADDIFLLCSDGLTDMVNDQMIAQALTELGDHMTPAAQRLIQLANAHGGVDNSTALLLKVHGEDEQPMVVL